MTFPLTVAFRATKIVTTLRVDVPVAIRATKILATVGVDIPVDRSFQSYQNPNNFKSWLSLFHHLWVHHTVNHIIPCHMWVHHTVRNVGPPHLGFSFLVSPPFFFLCNRSFQSYHDPINFKSWHSCSYQSYQKPGRHYTSHQLSELTKQFFGATKNLSTVGVDIPIDRIFLSYQNPNNFKSRISCSFQTYIKPGKHMLPVNYQSWQL